MSLFRFKQSVQCNYSFRLQRRRRPVVDEGLVWVSVNAVRLSYSILFMFARCAGATSMIMIVICTRCAGFYVGIHISQVHVYQ